MAQATGTQQRPKRASVPLHPRHDYAFADRLANDLLQHFGEWRALPSLYAPGVPDRCEIVRDVIVRLKRLGFLIEGDRRLGYRLTGFHGFRYVHVVQALTAPVKPPDETTQPGQMALFGDVGRG